MCERCGGELERFNLSGTLVLAQCKHCGRQRFIRAQVPRGVWWRGTERKLVIECAGECSGAES